MQETMTYEKRDELRRLAEFAKEHVRKGMCSRDEVDRLARGVLLLLDSAPLTDAEAGAIQAVSEVERLRKAATYAAAELRHAYRAHGLIGGRIDPGLVSRAIETLETAMAPSTTHTARVFTEAEVREVLREEHSASRDAEERHRTLDDRETAHYDGCASMCEHIAQRLNIHLG